MSVPGIQAAMAQQSAQPTGSVSAAGRHPVQPASARGNQSLIDRYSLSARVGNSDSERDSASGVEENTEGRVQVQTQGKASASAWADSKEAREKGLRERKEKMILEARR